MARRFAIGQSLGPELCEIFGLDKMLVDHINIEVESDALVKLTTTRYVTEEEGDKLTALFKDFYLVEREEAKPAEATA